jgi:hypothetical protein
MPDEMLDVRSESPHSGTPTKPIAHLSLDKGRTALCGLRLRGIRPFGPYCRCALCLFLWDNRPRSAHDIFARRRVAPTN